MAQGKLGPLVKEGYFVAPDGKVVLLQSTHIAMVVADPQRFGMTETVL
jgi:hypothetical protein